MRGQSKFHSMLEILTNKVLGFIISSLGNVFIFYVLEMDIKITTCMGLAFYFMCLAALKSYGVRRLFNYLYIRGTLK